MSLLKRLLRRKTNPEFNAALKPDGSLYVIGDVHGCVDLLQQLLAKQPKDSQLVFVGDLIDRGPDSEKVLTLVQKLCGKGAVCLMGNHEKMMLDFIDNPAEKGPRWMHYGGLQTLESMKLGGVHERSDEPALLMASHQLRKHFGEEGIQWMRSLPTQWQSGNMHVVHAAADPTQEMESQNNRVLLWGHPQFESRNRQDGQWVVYGHTIQSSATADNGRIAIDTGAYATGVLTAAYITNDHVEFFEARTTRLN